MREDARTRQLREASNPLFSDRKLRLGTFSSNLSGGCAISSIDGVLEADWTSTLTLAQLADEMQFEALVPVGRWKGFGGVTNFNGAGFESFSWAAGIGSATKYSGVFATSHVPTIHPVMAAKQATTIDHITRGRFSLNIVTGWYQPEIEMFGEPQMEHDARYDRAVEWLEVIKRLWTAEEEFDYEGRFYKVAKGWCMPKPIQQPYPVVMNAGGSERGRHYAAKFCDVAFLNLGSSDVGYIKKQIDAYKDLARREYGREIQVWSHAYIYRAGRDGSGSKVFLQLLRARERGLGGRRQLGEHARPQFEESGARTAEITQGAFRGRLGRLPPGWDQGMDRGRTREARASWVRRRDPFLAALHRTYAPISDRNTAFTRAGWSSVRGLPRKLWHEASGRTR